MSIFRRKPLLSHYRGQCKNPIYIEYYSHLACDCYKIDLPWSRYCKYTMVLCSVDKGKNYAIKLAKRIISEHLTFAIGEG